MSTVATTYPSYVVAAPVGFVNGVWRRVRRWASIREYAFHDRWVVGASVDRVSELLLDTARIAEWWPQMLHVQVLADGDRVGRSRAFSWRVKGFLPYELNVNFQIVEVQFPWRFRLEINGDLQGIGCGDLHQHRDGTLIDMHMKIRVARPLLQLLSFVIRPILRAQHSWVMRQGEAGLRRELARRQAAT